MKIGIIGVGTMGSRMLQKLIGARFDMVARDIDKLAEERARSMGATIANSPAEVGECCDIVLLSLPMPSDVDLVVKGADGILTTAREGSIVIDLSTVDPATSQKNYEAARERGIGYLDAPVLGRPMTCGNWTLPVGGDRDVFDKAKAVLQPIAKNIIHVGPSGSGNIIKLLNNMMFGAINSISAEIVALCAKVGMDPEVFFNTVANSGAATVSNLFKEIVPKMITRDFSPLFTIDLLSKDVMLGIKMAEENNAPLFISPSVNILNRIAQSKGLGSEDTSSVVKVYEDIFNVKTGRDII